MTKFDPRRKTYRKIIKKRRNEKYSFIHYEDSEVSITDNDENKTRVPSKQQYIRSKNKNFIQTHSPKSSSQNIITNIKKEENLLEKLNISELQHNSIKSSGIPSDDSNNSIFSFTIQPDWSDFEEVDHIKFLSDQDFDLSNVLHILGEQQNYDFDHSEDEDRPFIYDHTEKFISNWETEVSGDRLEQATIGINQIEQTIRENFKSLFTTDYDSSFWSDILIETNNILNLCESSKCFPNDLLIKDNTCLLQEKCLKWTKLASKCFSIKSCLEVVKDSEIVMNNFQISFDILYDQCETLLDHGIVYPGPMVVKIADGVKKIAMALKEQYTRIATSINELFPDCELNIIPFVDQLDDDIKRLERLSYNHGKSINQLELIRNILGKYLRRNGKRISVQEPVLNFCF